MADRGLRISWAMLAVSRPRGGEFQLLCLLLDAGQILQKDYDADVAGDAGLDETSSRRSVRLHRAQRIERGTGLAPPLFQPRGQRRRVILQQDFAVRKPQRTQDCFCPAVDLPYHTALVHYQHTVLHILNDQLIDLRHVGEVDFALRHDGLDGNCALRKRMRQPARGKKTDAKQSSLGVLRSSCAQKYHVIGMLRQDRDRGERRQRTVSACPG
jgi:hypothetical protein